MEGVLENLKKKRSVVRQLTTKLITKVESNLANNIPLNEKIEIIEDLYEQLIEKINELKILDSEIETKVTSEEIENEVTLSQEYQDKTVIWRGRMQRFLKKNSESSRTVHQNETANVALPVETKPVKLPRLQIGTYYGNSYKWLDFWNQFENTIHNHSGLRKTEKFAYLKSLLGGNALAAISGFALSDQNYDSAVEILKERFGRQDVVITSHMNKLLSLEPVGNISNVKALRKLYDECEVNIRSLESLNVTSGSYGNILCPIILHKFPEELNLEFNRSRNMEAGFDIKELIEFLKKEVNCREAASLMNSAKTNQKPYFRQNEQRTKVYPNYKPKVPTASALSTIGYKCIFCDKKDHTKYKCTEVKRCNWKIGKIKELFHGRDDRIRSCEIQLDKGVVRRPIERLYNLEVQ